MKEHLLMSCTLNLGGYKLYLGHELLYKLGKRTLYSPLRKLYIHTASDQNTDVFQKLHSIVYME